MPRARERLCRYCWHPLEQPYARYCSADCRRAHRNAGRRLARARGLRAATIAAPALTPGQLELLAGEGLERAAAQLEQLAARLEPRAAQLEQLAGEALERVTARLAAQAIAAELLERARSAA